MTFGDRQHRILRFWRDLEVFTPQALPVPQPAPTWIEQDGRARPQSTRMITVALADTLGFPWSVTQRAEERAVHPTAVESPWARHRVYVGIVAGHTVSEALLRLAPMQGVGGPSIEIARHNFLEKWRAAGHHALLALDLDEHGCLPRDPEAVHVSSLLLGLESLSQSGRLPAHGLRLTDRLAPERQGVLDRWRAAAEDLTRPMTATFLLAETERLQQRLVAALPDGWVPGVGVESWPAALPGATDPLNSPHFDALQDLVQALDPAQHPSPATRPAERPSLAFATYLGEPSPDSQRVDWLIDAEAFGRRLEPDRQPLGAWPGPQRLVAGQQAVVTELSHALRNGGLRTIHAPPGTGKTAVLQDLVAHAVIERAERLASKDNVMDWLATVNVPGGSACTLPSNELLRETLFVVAHRTAPTAEQLALTLPRADRLQDSGWRYLAPVARAWQTTQPEQFEHEDVWGPFALPLEPPSAVVAGRDRLLGQALPDHVGLLQLLRDEAGWKGPDWASARDRFLTARQRVIYTRNAVTQAIERARGLQQAWKARPDVEREYAQAAEALALVGTREDQMQSAAGHFYEDASVHVETLEHALAEAEKNERQAHRLRTRAELQNRLSPWGKWLAKMHASANLRRRLDAQREAEDAVFKAQVDVRQLGKELEHAKERAHLASVEWEKEESQWRRQHRRRQAAMLALQEKLMNLQLEIEALESQVDPAVRGEVLRWSRPLAQAPDHHVEPAWTPNDWPEALVWLDARKELFYSAMELHEAALFAWRSKLRSACLHHLPRLLTQPSDVPPVLREPLWNLLGFICPVLTTSLGACAHWFAGLRSGALGWLWVDDAAQTTPGALAWALQRSHRAVLVGDPRLMEPDVTVPPSLIDRLVEAHRVESIHRPDRVTALDLATRVMTQGTWVTNSHEGEQRLWVGLPLRAHSRCQSPMFDTVNHIAYAGQLAQMTPENHICRDGRLMGSFWWDIANESPTDTDTLVNPEELDALRTILVAWKQNTPQCGPTGTEGLATLAVLAPFREVATAAQTLVDELGLGDRVKASTIRAFQGQVVDTVVVMLGTPNGRAGAGARQWASQGPNLLTVALTRARLQCIVLGSKRDWQSRPFFDTLARQLPSRIDRTSIQP
jgi:hypothetical protein